MKFDKSCRYEKNTNQNRLIGGMYPWTKWIGCAPHDSGYIGCLTGLIVSLRLSECGVEMRITLLITLRIVPFLLHQRIL